jgi:hypothetical protein
MSTGLKKAWRRGRRRGRYDSLGIDIYSQVSMSHEKGSESWDCPVISFD